MTISVANVQSNQTFLSWLTTTNIMARVISANAVTADATTGGSITSGNAYVNGSFGANYLYANAGIVGGNVSTNGAVLILSNTAFRYSTSNLVTIQSNSTATSLAVQTNTVSIQTTQNVQIGGAVLNINSIAVNVASNTVALTANHVLTTSANIVFRANSSFNAISITNSAAGPVIIANTANTTIAGNVALNNNLTVTGSANLLSTIRVSGAANLLSTVAITGAANLASTLGVVGNATFSNSINVALTVNAASAVISGSVNAGSVNTATLNVISGLANLAGNVVVGGNLSVASNATFNNRIFVTNEANVGSLYTVGNANVAGSLKVGGNLDVGGSLVYAGSATSDILPSANLTYNLGSTARYWATVYTANLVVINLASLNTATISRTLTVTGNATLSNSIIVTGNATFSNTIAVTGNATFSNTGAFTGNLTTSSSLIVTNQVVQGASSLSTRSTGSYTFTNSNTMATIDSFTTNTFRSVEYLIQTTDTTAPANSHQITKLLMVQDATTAFITEYATITTNAAMGIFNAAISAGTLSLRYTPVSNNVIVKFTRNGIAL